MLDYQGYSNYIVLTNSGVAVSNNIIFDEDNTCHLPTPHAEGEVLIRGVPRFRQDWKKPKSWKVNDPARS